jgi:hypothetical protein
MAIGFTVKDIMHKITAKFIHAFLPDGCKIKTPLFPHPTSA